MAHETGGRVASDITGHEYQHDLIEKRVIEHDKLPRRSGADRLRLHHSALGVVSTVSGHLVRYHGWKSHGPPKSIAELLAIHEKAHEGGPRWLS